MSPAPASLCGNASQDIDAGTECTPRGLAQRGGSGERVASSALPPLPLRLQSLTCRVKPQGCRRTQLSAAPLSSSGQTSQDASMLMPPSSTSSSTVSRLPASDATLSPPGKAALDWHRTFESAGYDEIKQGVTGTTCDTSNVHNNCQWDLESAVSG
jgi:hypothetical protein